MSSDPELIEGTGASAEMQLHGSFYTGPRAADGHHPTMVQLTQHVPGQPGILQLTPHQAHRLTDWLVANGYGAPGREHFAELGRFVCPKCCKVSNSPDDLKHGYCGRCHDWTADDRV